MSVVFEKWSGSEWVSVPFSRWKRVVNDTGFMRLSVFSNLNGKSLVSSGDQVRLIDGSKVFFRGFLKSGGRVSETGEVFFEADGYGKQFSGSKFLSNPVSTSNINLISSTLSGTGVSLDSSGAVSRNITYPGFSGPRHRVWEEMTSFYNHRLIFLPDLTARYELSGAFSSGVSVDTSVDNVKILSYESELDEDLLTRVEVVGRDLDDNVIVASSGSGDIFSRVQVGFVKSLAQLQDIADSLLVLEKKDSLKFKRFWFEDEVLVNKTMSFVDVPRGINDVFVVVRQEDFFPERSSVLTLGTDEDANAVRRGHRESAELDEERNTLFEDFLSSVEGNVDSHRHNPVDSGHDHLDPNVTTTTSDIRSDFNINNIAGSGNLNTSVSVPNITGGVENVLVHFHCAVNKESIDVSPLGLNVRVRNISASRNYYFESNVMAQGDSISGSLLLNKFSDDIVAGDIIRLDLFDSNNFNLPSDILISVQSLGGHSHVKPASLVDEDNASVNDFNRSPGFSGEAETSKAKNVLREAF